MIKGFIVLCGSHGGELDREPIGGTGDEADAKAALQLLVDRITLANGDVITIQAEGL